MQMAYEKYNDNVNQLLEFCVRHDVVTISTVSNHPGRIPPYTALVLLLDGTIQRDAKNRPGNFPNLHLLVKSYMNSSGPRITQSRFSSSSRLFEKHGKRPSILLINSVITMNVGL